MLKSLGTTLLTGFITLFPVVITAYLLYWMVVSSEGVMAVALHWVFPDAHYFPGMGVIVALLIVFAVGLLMKAILIRELFSFGETILYRLPLIKTIYRAMRDLFDYFSPKKEGLGQVVAVTYEGAECIGFVTQTDESRLPDSFSGKDKVLVYIPMSYMIGGFTIFVPRENVRELDMKMEEAMRFVLTAGITGKNVS